MKEKIWKLKHPKPVTEDEFLGYLDKVCENEYLKKIVLSYYKTMKRIDHKYGKNIGIGAFKRGPLLSGDVQLVADQALRLFGAGEFASMFYFDGLKFYRVAHSLVGHIKNPTIKKRLKDSLVKAQKKQFDFFYSNKPHAPVGKTELFRWQFVNYVNKIVAQEDPADSYIGRVVLLDGVVTVTDVRDLSKISESLDKKYQYYINRAVLFHELTHILTERSSGKGYYRFLSPWEYEFNGRVSINADARFLQNQVEPNKNSSYYDPMVLNAFSDGVRLINEFATERFVAYAVNSKCVKASSVSFYEEYSHSPRMQTVVAFPEQKGEPLLVKHSSYDHFGCLFQLLYDLIEAPEEIVLSSRHLPLDLQYLNIKMFFTDVKFSPEIQKRVDEVLKQEFATSDEVLNLPNLEFQKFVLLLGLKYKDFIRLKNSPKGDNCKNDISCAYDDRTMLLQAMIIDVQHQYLLACAEEVRNSHDVDARKELEEVVRAGIDVAKKATDWIIKPNQKDKNGDLLSDHMTSKELARLYPDCISLMTWVKYLETLKGLAKSAGLELGGRVKNAEK